MRSWQKLDITVHKDLNMDMFLTQSIDSLQEAFINPTEPCGTLFMMDGCTFLGFKISTTIHSYYKAWKSQDIF